MSKNMFMEAAGMQQDKTEAEQVSEETQSLETTGGTVLGTIFDVLSRTEYASANVFKNIVTGQKQSLSDLFTTEGLKTTLPDAWKGISGQSKITYDDLVPQIFPDWGPWKQKAMSFFMAVAMDPLTWVPGKAITAPIKGAGNIAGRLIPEAVKESDAVNLFGKAFVPGYGLPKDYYEMKYFAQKKLGYQQEEIIKDIKQLKKGLSDDDRQTLFYMREHPNELGNLYPKLRDKLDQIGSRFDSFIDDALENDIITPEQAAKWRGNPVPYVPHYYPERGISILKGTLPPTLFEKTKKPSFMKERTFETAEDAKVLSEKFWDVSRAQNLDDAKALIQSHGLEEAFGKIDNLDHKALKSLAEVQAKWYMPEEDILKALGYRSFEQAATISRKQFIDDVLTQFGQKVQPGTKATPEGFGIYLPKGSLRMFQRDAISPKSLNQFVAQMQDWAEQLRHTEVRRERVIDETVTTQVMEKGGVEASSEGVAAKLEGVVKEALTSRGFTDGEASNYISRLKKLGKNGVDSDQLITETKTRVESIREILETSPGEMIDIPNLPEITKERILGITTKVPTYMLPKEIADDLNRYNKFFIGDPTSSKVLTWMWDKPLNAWKTMATTLRVPFHIRNFYSNVTQSWLSGLENPERFVQAAKLQLSKNQDDTLKLGGKYYTVGELWTAIGEHGIHGKGWLGADIQKHALKEMETMLEQGVLRRVGHNLNPVKWGRALGTAFEDNARIAVFIDQLDKGKTFKEASQTVRKYLFDYSELTDFEKNVARRVMPFYTWTRKNSELQMETLLMKPKKYAYYGKGLRAISDPETEEEIGNKPEYFNQMNYVKSPWESENGKPIYMNVDLPMNEWNRISELRHWMNSVAPQKLALELAYNVKTFPDVGPLRKYPLDMTRAPVWTAWLPEKVLGVLKDKHIIDKKHDSRMGEDVLLMRKDYALAVGTAFPFLNELNRIYAQPISMQDDAPELKWKSFLTGVGLASLDPETMRNQLVFSKKDHLTNMARFIIQHGRSPDDEEMKILEPPRR